MLKVVFRLKRIWYGRDLWNEIISGKKRIEFRDFTTYWGSRLMKNPAPSRCWFTVGYPKGNLPRLEADITDIYVKFDQIQIHFTNVIEIKKIFP